MKTKTLLMKIGNQVTVALFLHKGVSCVRSRVLGVRSRAVHQTSAEKIYEVDLILGMRHSDQEVTLCIEDGDVDKTTGEVKNVIVSGMSQRVPLVAAMHYVVQAIKAADKAYAKSLAEVNKKLVKQQKQAAKKAKEKEKAAAAKAKEKEKKKTKLLTKPGQIKTTADLATVTVKKTEKKTKDKKAHTDHPWSLVPKNSFEA